MQRGKIEYSESVIRPLQIFLNLYFREGFREGLSQGMRRDPDLTSDKCPTVITDSVYHRPG